MTIKLTDIQPSDSKFQTTSTPIDFSDLCKVRTLCLSAFVTSSMLWVSIFMILNLVPQF